jgi:hypothetical protein
MFGLDTLFDFDKNGRLGAFERAAERAFISSAGEASRKSDRRYEDRTRLDRYGSEKDDSDWED